MADLMFSHNAGMQDSMGDSSYMHFRYKDMSIVAKLSSHNQPKPSAPYATYASSSPTCPSPPKSPPSTSTTSTSSRPDKSTSPRDLFRYLLAEDSETGSRLTQPQLDSNANLAVVAGSSTTSSSLTQAFRVLATDHRIRCKLQVELDHACPDNDDDAAAAAQLTAETTKTQPYFSAVVNEVLCLYNAVPCGIQATPPPPPPSASSFPTSPPPGLLPSPDPHATLMNDARYFPSGDAFIPERWTGERPDLAVRDRRAFIPFGYGVHSCVGKQLALNEMRLTIARVVRVGRLRSCQGRGGARGGFGG